MEPDEVLDPEKLERTILEALETQPSVPELLEGLNKQGRQDLETAIKEAISRLTAQGKIEMTAQRWLRRLQAGDQELRRPQAKDQEKQEPLASRAAAGRQP